MVDTLAGTVALVTGASSGIGAATAVLLAEHGASVGLVARRVERLKELAEQIAATGAETVVVEADITQRGAARDAVARVVTELGRLDTVVNNAGVALPGPVADSPKGEWEQMVAVNQLGLMYVSQAAIPHLCDAAAQGPRNVADLVNISSTSGRVARPGSAGYAMTKFGVAAFSEALRQELQPKRVRVGVVAPGNVDTELASHVRDGLRDGVAARIKDIEQLRAEDIARAVGYLVTSPRRVAVNEILVRAADQTW